MNGALKQQINGNDKWCLTPITRTNWSNVAAGSYSLTATATDNLGAATTTAPINVIVNAPPSAAGTTGTDHG